MYKELFKYNTKTGVFQSVEPTQNIDDFKVLNEDSMMAFKPGFTDVKPEGMALYQNVSPKFEGGQWHENAEAVKSYLESLKNPKEEAISELSTLDSPRDAEDLVDLLVSKNIIQESELPAQMQNRLTRKRELRNMLSAD